MGTHVSFPTLSSGEREDEHSRSARTSGCLKGVGIGRARLASQQVGPPAHDPLVSGKGTRGYEVHAMSRGRQCDRLLDSLYILTKENGQWGVKMRSSFAP